MKKLALLLLLAAPAFASGGGVPPDRYVYIQGGFPGSWCPGPAGDEFPVLYAFNKRTRLGVVRPATCALINGYAARSALHLRCETAGTWSPVAVLADAALKQQILDSGQCYAGNQQDFR